VFRNLLLRLYNRLTRPLYARIMSDATTQVQQALASNLEKQEKFAAKILDELILTRLELERVGKPVEDKYKMSLSDTISDEEISKIVNEMTSHMRIVELACEHGLPIEQLVTWREKYGGMSPQLVRKMRWMEAENERLKQTIVRLKLDERVESEAGLFS
jgi:putative transposase